MSTGMSNRELIEKAQITTAALAAAGKLNPKQADRFIDFVIDVTAMSNNVRVVRFRNEQMTIDKIGVGRRVAVPKTEATDPGVRKGVTTSKVTLQPAVVMVPFEISDEFQEINIEGETIEDTIIRLMATQVANDLEELYINGDVLGVAVPESFLVDGGSNTNYVKDTYLALKDGWLRLADGGNIFDAASTAVSSQVFSDMINTMPDKFKRNRANLRFFSSTDHEQQYRQTVSSRATAAGDVALSSTLNLTPFGIQLVPVPLQSATPTVVEHVTLTGTTAVALRYENITDVVVLPSTLASTPVTPYIETTDYVVNYAAGTIARTGGGAITSGQVVKVTYKSQGAILLTDWKNFILAIGRDIRIEKDRDIFKGVNQYAITVKIDQNFEELEAVVKGINIPLV